MTTGVFWANFLLKILISGILRVPSIQGLAKNMEMKVLFFGFHRRTNLLAMAINFSSFGSRNKTTYSDYWSLTIKGYFPFTFWHSIFFTNNFINSSKIRPVLIGWLVEFHLYEYKNLLSNFDFFGLGVVAKIAFTE
jgi:hypothetical protein